MYRKYDSKLKTEVTTIFAGEYYVSNKNEVISTVLGSCISVCLYDPVYGVGGINHFMLPGENDESGNFYTNDSKIRNEKLSENSMKYGIKAMEILIAEMQKKGALRKHFKAKIFGGGKVLNRSSNLPSVGDHNIRFIRSYLKMEGIPIEKEDVGDSYGRKIYFLSGSEKILVKNVAIVPAVEEERIYMQKLKDLKTKSDITIF